jgi:hypothetical protein
MPAKKTPTKRNYKKEYKEYHGTPKQKANRAARGRARYKLEKSGAAKKGDGKDVDHKDGNPRNNSRKNLKVISRSKNRAKK